MYVRSQAQIHKRAQAKSEEARQEHERAPWGLAMLHAMAADTCHFRMERDLQRKKRKPPGIDVPEPEIGECVRYDLKYVKRGFCALLGESLG